MLLIDKMAPVALALVFGHAASAQSAGPTAGHGLLAGLVRDTAGAAVASALVQIYRVQEPVRPIQAHSTTSAGAFRTDSLPVGAYVVLVKMVGYRPWTDTVVVRGGRTDSLSATLRHDRGTLAQIGRAPSERDSSTLRLQFQTTPGSPDGLCDGVQFVETTATSIRVTGFLGSATAPLSVHGRAYRDGSGIVLDVIPQPQDNVVMVTACVRWQADLFRLVPSIYTLNVRRVSDPRDSATTTTIFHRVVDLRHPDTLRVDVPSRQ